jgi:protein O-mannosyl-transferase
LSYSTTALTLIPFADSGVRTGLVARARVACGVAAFLAGIVYVNALRNPFVYDDHRTVVSNSSIEQLTNIKAIAAYDMMRPITNFSYAVDRALWGTSPVGFHVTSVLLHVLNIVLLFLIAWRLNEDWQRRFPAEGRRDETLIVASVASVLLAVHPIVSQAVGYISARSEVLCSSFFLIAILCGRRWILGGEIRFALLTVVFWALALATKETGAMLPFVLFACGRLVIGGTPAEKRRRIPMVHAPLLAMATAAGLVRVAILRVEYPGQVSIHWDYLLLGLEVVRRQILLMFKPGGQSIFHEVSPVGLFDPRAIASIALLGLLVAFAWSVRRARGLVTLGIAWFFLLLVPSFVLTVLDRGEPMTEHRVYLASCGLFLAVGAGAGWVSAGLARASATTRKLVLGGAVVVAFSLAVQTVLRNAVWSDPVALWSEAVELAPKHYRPHLLLGEALQDAGRHDEAADEFKSVIQMRPAEPAGYMKLGLLYAEMRRLGDAEATFERLQLIDPQSASATLGLGTVAVLSSDAAAARNYFLQTIDRDPRNIPARQSLARLNEMAPANPAEALRLCEEIQHIDPRTPGNDECIRRNRSRLETGSSDR